MSRTGDFRLKHQELFQVASEISALLKHDELSNDASKVRGLLSMLAGKLKLHLVMEDEHLYPDLVRHSNEKVRKLARKYIDEMGGIAGTFDEYMNRWVSAADIQNNAKGFIEETKAVFKALSKRIEKEDNELYPLIDNLA